MFVTSDIPIFSVYKDSHLFIDGKDVCGWQVEVEEDLLVGGQPLWRGKCDRQVRTVHGVWSALLVQGIASRDDTQEGFVL